MPTVDIISEQNGLYDPNAFTTIGDLYTALKEKKLGIFERGEMVYIHIV
jgi:hypothetical protein